MELLDTGLLNMTASMRRWVKEGCHGLFIFLRWMLLKQKSRDRVTVTSLRGFVERSNVRCDTFAFYVVGAIS
jgi:hypothetical protein